MLFRSLVGCMGGKTIPTNVSDTAGIPECKDALLDLKELLKRLAEGKIKPPASAEQFATYDVEHPAIATLIANRMVLYSFGSTIDGTSSGNKWVAMQTTARESGGWVLLSNGDIKEMPASDVAKLQPAIPGK